jgi:hypothetical protein
MALRQQQPLVTRMLDLCFPPIWLRGLERYVNLENQLSARSKPANERPKCKALWSTGRTILGRFKIKFRITVTALC